MKHNPTLARAVDLIAKRDAFTKGSGYWNTTMLGGTVDQVHGTTRTPIPFDGLGDWANADYVVVSFWWVIAYAKGNEWHLPTSPERLNSDQRRHLAVVKEALTLTLT